MTIKRASLFLFSLYLAMFLFNESMSLVKPSLEPITGMGYMMINKTIFAVGLLILVYGLKLQRQCGLVFKANWRTLPLYWPMVVIAGLTLIGGINTDTSGSMLAIIFVTVVVGSFGEELMFRGLVFHWFRDLSVRKQILISGLSFGGLHLLGVGVAYEIILAQVYFAAGLGLVWGYARARDYSIMIPILVHVVFNLIVIGSKGGVVEGATSAPPEQVVMGVLVVGTIGWAWGGFLLWKAGKENDFVSPHSSTSTI